MSQSSVKEVLDALMKHYGLTEKFKENRVIEVWEKVMGPFVSQKTTDVKVVKHKLYISLSSAALRSEMQFEKERIISLMNTEIGEDFIKEVVIG